MAREKKAAGQGKGLLTRGPREVTPLPTSDLTPSRSGKETYAACARTPLSARASPLQVCTGCTSLKEEITLGALGAQGDYGRSAQFSP